MLFSKSFGYALRGVLYVAIMNEKKPKVPLDEIAETLNVPRYFMGKVMNRLVKGGILNAVKGHNGGFSINQTTLQTCLVKFIDITGETEQFDTCALRLQKCNFHYPCPLHADIEKLRNYWSGLLTTTTIGDLLKKNGSGFIRSITTI